VVAYYDVNLCDRVFQRERWLYESPAIVRPIWAERAQSLFALFLWQDATAPREHDCSHRYNAVQILRQN
jgi:hypothetical protein